MLGVAGMVTAVFLLSLVPLVAAEVSLGLCLGARYATLGFSDTAALDDGAMWPVGFALKELTAAEEARITALVRKSVS